MNISKITIGRLYNLGNYEHIRYEVTVDVAPGESAAQAVLGLESIMRGLKPVKMCGICSDDDLKRKSAEIARMSGMDDATWEREFGHCTGTREDVIQRYVNSLEADRNKRSVTVKRAAKARADFDNLGGASVYTDSKDDWEDSF